MGAFLLNVLLALAWVALTGRFNMGNFAFGFVLGYGALWLAQRVLGPSSYFGKARRLIGFVLFFLWEVIKANLQVAYIVLNPRYRMHPGVIAVPAGRADRRGNHPAGEPDHPHPRLPEHRCLGGPQGPVHPHDGPGGRPGPFPSGDQRGV
jgi:hypothetical protein